MRDTDPAPPPLTREAGFGFLWSGLEKGPAERAAARAHAGGVHEGGFHGLCVAGLSRPLQRDRGDSEATYAERAAGGAFLGEGAHGTHRGGLGGDVFVGLEHRAVAYVLPRHPAGIHDAPVNEHPARPAASVLAASRHRAHTEVHLDDLEQGSLAVGLEGVGDARPQHLPCHRHDLGLALSSCYPDSKMDMESSLPTSERPRHTLGATSDVLALLSDPTRMRLMALLTHEELTVAELMSVTQLGQSRVSTHLGHLRNAGLLRDRRAGASVYYCANEASMPAHARDVWQFLLGRMRDPILEDDRKRCAGVVKARKNGSWADAVAGEMDRHYSPGRTWEATARGLSGLARFGDVVDLGSGDGTIAELLSPFASRVVCVDINPRMVAAGRERLKLVGNVELLLGDMHALPFESGSFDHALLFNSLTYAERPSRVIAEAARVLGPGGRMAIITLKAHKHAIAQSDFNHIHPGFEPRALKAWLAAAGLVVETCGVTSRERREPHFEVLTAHATKKGRNGGGRRA
jgi:SAM-dependent methyltransferase